MSKFLIFLCVVSVVVGCSDATIITSEAVTNWGDWATDMERCPPGTAVQGFQVLSETIVSVDTTSMNGLKLFCGNAFDETTPMLISNVGPWGTWGTKHRCDIQGFVTGFQLRVEEPAIAQDETATNNIRIFCSLSEEPIQGDGQMYGTWGAEYHCPAGEVVCGLRTQVQEDQGNILDDTALNNISMECCAPPAQ